MEDGEYSYGIAMHTLYSKALEILSSFSYTPQDGSDGVSGEVLTCYALFFLSPSRESLKEMKESKAHCCKVLYVHCS